MHWGERGPGNACWYFGVFGVHDHGLCSTLGLFVHWQCVVSARGTHFGMEVWGTARLQRVMGVCMNFELLCPSFQIFLPISQPWSGATTSL